MAFATGKLRNIQFILDGGPHVVGDNDFIEAIYNQDAPQSNQ